METHPVRKRIRLPVNLYHRSGAYFITICTRNRENLFWNEGGVGAALRRPPDCLSAYGRITATEIDRIGEIYSGFVEVDHAVVMPNHVHLLLSIHLESEDDPTTPGLSRVINQFKGSVSKRIGFSCWQKSFHDHIVRNEDDYREIWTYIDNNPAKWNEDRYYL